MRLKEKLSAKLPLWKAFLLIFISTLFISGSAFAGLFYFYYVKAKREADPKYSIKAIVQSSSEKEALKTAYLAEILGLSVDKPVNLYSFNSKEAEKKLISCPLIEKAEVKKIKPSTIYIDYKPRQPIAILGDFTNTAMDENGFLFPFYPFFGQKKLPEIYLGLSNIAWGKAVKGPCLEKAIALLKYIEEECSSKNSSIVRIDASQAEAPSCGQRQMIVLLEEKIERVIAGKPAITSHSRLLRLTSENFKEELKNYTILRKYLQKNEQANESLKEEGMAKKGVLIIDLRIPNLAYLSSM